MPVVHGTTDWPNSGGDEGWGGIDIATNKIWLPAMANLHTGGSDYWTLWNVLAVPGPGGPKQLGQREGVGHTDGDALLPIAAIQTAAPADKAGETHYVGLQMKDGRLWVSAILTGTVPLPTGAATEASLAAAIASLSVLDDWDETDRAKVNLIAGQAGITGGAGAAAANTPRVTLASDDPLNAKLAAAAALAAGTAYPTTSIVRSTPMLDNGATLDPETGNVAATALASAARTVTTAATVTNRNCKGLVMFVNITAVAGGGETLTPSIQIIDPVSGQNPNIWVAATPQTTTGIKTYVFYPGIAAAGGGSQVLEHVSLALPRTFALRINHSAAGSWTYSVGYCLLV